MSMLLTRPSLDASQSPVRPRISVPRLFLNTSPLRYARVGMVLRISEIRLGSSLSPKKRRLANTSSAFGSDFVLDVAKRDIVFIRHRAVIPYGDPVGRSQPTMILDPVYGSAKLPPGNSEPGCNAARRVAGIAPNNPRHRLIRRPAPAGAWAASASATRPAAGPRRSAGGSAP